MVLGGTKCKGSKSQMTSHKQFPGCPCRKWVAPLGRRRSYEIAARVATVISELFALLVTEVRRAGRTCDFTQPLADAVVVTRIVSVRAGSRGGVRGFGTHFRNVLAANGLRRASSSRWGVLGAGRTKPTVWVPIQSRPKKACNPTRRMTPMERSASRGSTLEEPARRFSKRIGVSPMRHPALRQR